VTHLTVPETEGEPLTTEEGRLGPVALYKHDHPAVRDVLAEHQEKMSLGQRIAVRLAAGVGSWPFILIQSALLALWISVNVYLVVMMRIHPGYLRSWDPYPFILLNLVLSFQAAYTGPVVLMSQNRGSERDRLMARHDYEINCKTEREIQVVMDHLAHQDRLLLDAVRRLEALRIPPPAQPAADQSEEVLNRVERKDDRRVARLRRRDEKHPRARGYGPGHRA
jgi:uncharacterized membrane protein